MSKLQESDVPKEESNTLIGDIGICMSGGGYRAASFHLGTLDYIEKLNLAGNITALSTVSGGTFTGTKYILSLVENQHFDSFFNEYYYQLKDTHLVAEGLKQLASQEDKVASGRQDLIVSMAQIYSETLFCRKVLCENDANSEATTPYYFDTILHGEQPIKDVMFNATDFRSGIAFRFQRSSDPEAKIGNFYNNIDVKDAGKIRLADIVAASSCFPGGFEPISFPYDFTWQGGDVPKDVAFAFPMDRSNEDPTAPKGPVPLMDGGVYDNQGLESLLLADKRNGNNLDLVVVSDVDQPSLELYDMPEPMPNDGITLKSVYKIGLIFFWLCIATLLTIGIYAWRDFIDGELQIGRSIFLYVIPFVLTLIAAGTLFYVRKIIQEDLLPHIPSIGERAADSLARLTTGQVRNMLNLRFTSLMALTTSVFMKRIRSLVYKLAYGEGRDIYNGKRLSNLIYSLSPAKTQQIPIQGTIKPSKLLDKVACVAFNQPTTLWFDFAYQQACLVASGQASMCYNMLKLLSVRYGEDPEQYNAQVKALWHTLNADWLALNNDPFCILKKSVNEDWDLIDKEVCKIECNWGMFEGNGPGIEGLAKVDAAIKG